MDGITITDAGGLIVAKIIPRTETYYLVTQENLSGIVEKNILTDVFTLIASLLWGAFFSVLISLKASSNLPDAIKQALGIYQSVFLGSALGFSLLAALFLIMTHMRIKSLKKLKLTANTDPKSNQSRDRTAGSVAAKGTP